MRNFGFLEILIILLVILVLLSIFVVVLAMIYPAVTQQLLTELRQDVGSNRSWPIVTVSKIGKRAAAGFNARIRPAADFIISLFSRKRVEEREKRAESEPASNIDFKSCVTGSCHPGLYDRVSFNNIYMNHRLHKANSIDCSVCHKREHPKPSKAKQSTCLDCHRKVKAVVACSGCHTPGSILSDDVNIQSKEDFLAGVTASHKVLVPTSFEHPVGDANGPCKNCHEVPTFCNRCHLVFHKEIPDWVPTHGRKLLGGLYVMNVCWTCHNANWCGTTCHSNAPSRTRRTTPSLQLPPLPLENYVER